MVPEEPNKYSAAFSPKKDQPINVAMAKAMREIPRSSSPHEESVEKAAPV